MKSDARTALSVVCIFVLFVYPVETVEYFVYFEQSVLLAHIDSILKNRDLRQKKFVEQDLNPILLEVGQSDQQFMNEVMNILEKN